MSIDPTPYQHAVELMLATDGLTVDVWDEYVVTLDMLQAGNPWTFAFWRSDPVTGQTTGDRRTTWDLLRRTAKLGDNVLLTIDGAAQLNGRIETMNAGGGRGGISLVIGGRDLAGPAMDCDVSPTVTIKNMAFGAALIRVFDELGLNCAVTSSRAAQLVSSGSVPGPRAATAAAERKKAGLITQGTVSAATAAGLSTAASSAVRRAVVDIAHPKPGERVWNFAESMAKRLGCLLWVAPAADNGIAVVADVPNDQATPSYVFLRREVLQTAGAYEGNILDGNEKLNLRGVPTVITTYSGTDRGNNTSARTREVTTNVAVLDPQITRGLVLDPPPPQPKHVRSTRSRTQQRSAQEASNSILEGMRSFRTYECRVRGHGQTVDGVKRLYALNTVARVRDDVCIAGDGTPLDEDMLIVRIEFRGSRQSGTTTTLTLCPRGALVLTPTEPTT
jgi:prophage tail gpP-like protein